MKVVPVGPFLTSAWQVLGVDTGLYVSGATVQLRGRLRHGPQGNATIMALPVELRPWTTSFGFISTDQDDSDAVVPEGVAMFVQITPDGNVGIVERREFGSSIKWGEWQAPPPNVLTAVVIGNLWWQTRASYEVPNERENIAPYLDGWTSQGCTITRVGDAVRLEGRVTNVDGAKAATIVPVLPEIYRPVTPQRILADPVDFDPNEEETQNLIVSTGITVKSKRELALVQSSGANFPASDLISLEAGGGGDQNQPSIVEYGVPNAALRYPIKLAQMETGTLHPDGVTFPDPRVFDVVSRIEGMNLVTDPATEIGTIVTFGGTGIQIPNPESTEGDLLEVARYYKWVAKVSGAQWRMELLRVSGPSAQTQLMTFSPWMDRAAQPNGDCGFTLTPSDTQLALTLRYGNGSTLAYVEQFSTGGFIEDYTGMFLYNPSSQGAVIRTYVLSRQPPYVTGAPEGVTYLLDAMWPADDTERLEPNVVATVVKADGGRSGRIRLRK